MKRAGAFGNAWPANGTSGSAVSGSEDSVSISSFDKGHDGRGFIAGGRRQRRGADRKVISSPLRADGENEAVAGLVVGNQAGLLLIVFERRRNWNQLRFFRHDRRLPRKPLQTPVANPPLAHRAIHQPMLWRVEEYDHEH